MKWKMFFSHMAGSMDSSVQGFSDHMAGSVCLLPSAIA